MSDTSGWKKKPFWIRLFHWEYWSFNTVYLPIYPVFIFLCLRARSFFFYAASNPNIKNGGFLGESKKDIYGQVPARWQPKTIFFTVGANPDSVLDELLRAGFQFPMIGKPDIGARGRGVKKLNDAEEVLKYVSSARVDFHVQEFISYENEAGIFYYRFPGQAKGKISGIVHKEFLKVTGDGKLNTRELLQASPRAILQIPILEQTEPALLNHLPAAGEVLTVVPYGNHARGAMFLDDSGSINEKLENVMDEICRQIPLFYFGRMDIRYQSREELEEGKSFFILEVNGAGSEPTHIYDPRHSIFFAWKEIIRHWLILFKISRANHKLGFSYLTVKEGVRMFKKDKSDSKLLESMI
ncbi:MAG TPA: hypothetical protein VFE04_01060 [Puia sp.]|nr:hypothetical protein [Puia sp.]